jgi:hypothetical protein
MENILFLNINDKKFNEIESSVIMLMIRKNGGFIHPELLIQLILNYFVPNLLKI